MAKSPLITRGSQPFSGGTAHKSAGWLIGELPRSTRTVQHWYGEAMPMQGSRHRLAGLRTTAATSCYSTNSDAAQHVVMASGRHARRAW